MRATALAATAVLLTLGSCSYGTQEDQRPYRPPGIAHKALPESGRDLYMRDCAWCHGNEGGGTSRGPDLVSETNGPALNHFVLSTGRMPLDDPDQSSTRREPVYSDDEIDAIVEFARSFEAPGPEIPDVDPEADLVAGGLLYQENCAACHSTTGIGGALMPGSGDDAIAAQSNGIAPSLAESSALETAEAIRTGPGTMPVFGEETLDDEEMSAIVRHVTYLQDPSDRGGAPVGRVGPVVEGAIGWIVGLGALLIFIRWVGTRRGEL